MDPPRAPSGTCERKVDRPVLLADSGSPLGSASQQLPFLPRYTVSKTGAARIGHQMRTNAVRFGPSRGVPPHSPPGNGLAVPPRRRRRRRRPRTGRRASPSESNSMRTGKQSPRTAATWSTSTRPSPTRTACASRAQTAKSAPASPARVRSPASTTGTSTATNRGSARPARRITAHVPCRTSRPRRRDDRSRSDGRRAHRRSRDPGRRGRDVIARTDPESVSPTGNR